jgi:hypothetical protein
LATAADASRSSCWRDWFWIGISRSPAACRKSVPPATRCAKARASASFGKHDLAQRAGFLRAIFGLALAIGGGDLRFGRLRGRGDLVGPEQGVADHPPLRHGIAALICPVESVHFALARGKAVRHRFGSDQPDAAAALLQQQRGIALGHALRHGGRSRHRHHDLPLDQAGGQVLAQLRFRDALLAQRLLELLLVELPGQVLEARNAGDLRIHHPLGRGQALLAPEHQHRLGVDQLVDDRLEAALREEAGHIQVGNLAAQPFHLPIDLVRHFGGRDLLVRHLDQGVAGLRRSGTADTARVDARDHHRQRDEAEQGEHDPGGTSAAEK